MNKSFLCESIKECLFTKNCLLASSALKWKRWMAMKKCVQNFNSSWKQIKLYENKHGYYTTSVSRSITSSLDVLLCYVSKKCVNRRIVYRLKLTISAEINAASCFSSLNVGVYTFCKFQNGHIL